MQDARIMHSPCLSCVAGVKGRSDKTRSESQTLHGMAGKNGIGQSCDGFTRRRLRDVGQDEKGEELTQQKCEHGERASGLSRGTEERKKTGEKTRERVYCILRKLTCNKQNYITSEERDIQKSCGCQKYKYIRKDISLLNNILYLKKIYSFQANISDLTIIIRVN